MKAITTYFLPVAFLLSLVFPFVNDLTGFMQFERKSENRVFHDSLSINIQKLDNFPKDFEAYYNDNFSFRSPLLSAYNKIKFNLLGVSPDKKNLIIGKDGWYFMGGTERDIYEGRLNFSVEEIDAFRKEWKSRKNYCEQRGIQLYWLICPVKQEIYPEKLPFNANRQAGLSRTRMLKQALEKDLPQLIIDPSDMLRRHKDKYKLYFQLDNHWTYRAGSLTAAYCLDIFRSKLPDLPKGFLPEYQWRDSIKKDGVHYAALGIKDLSETYEAPLNAPKYAVREPLYHFPIPEGFVYHWDHEHRFSNRKNGKYRILVIRDSFGSNIMPFLADAFVESVFIFDAWKFELNEQIINTVKPDIILYLSLESHLENFIAK